MDDCVSLDVHAISELKDKGFAPTDDAKKYCYKADDTGNYSKCCIFTYVCRYTYTCILILH